MYHGEHLVDAFPQPTIIYLIFSDQEPLLTGQEIIPKLLFELSSRPNCSADSVSSSIVVSRIIEGFMVRCCFLLLKLVDIVDCLFFGEGVKSKCGGGSDSRIGWM